MKIHKRILRALFSLVREELLEFVGFQNNSLPNQGVTHPTNYVNIDTEMIQMSVSIDMSKIGRDPMGDVTYEKELEKAKARFAEFIIEHVHVETKDLSTPSMAFERSLHFTLRVQKKQEY